MRTSITVNIPEPCHEDWNKMTPRDKGRHCAACNKTVIDFTNQTDEEIVKTFKTKGNLCGRFKNQQLNRELVLSRKEKNNYRSWAASGLFAFLAIGVQKSFAQIEPIKTEQIDSLKIPQVKGKPAQSILNEKIISGTVTAASDGLPLPGVTVLVKGTAKGTSTDIDGKYTLKVKNDDTLVFNFVSMKSTEKIVGTNSIINIAMADDLSVLEQVVLGGFSAGMIETSYFNYPKYREEIYETIENKKRDYERRLEKQNMWNAKNIKNRLKWKAERLARKLARQDARKAKKDN
ncbi:carboxypeptidase-like regulatory domain-containing protein [Winogradskyella immobilis]|uniref:Carboxypeptidase-like regulatory domain-containing protein n=1 Tax=Winogradskyella immobilis TaxID=2816852 RepID=A0ABS8EK73_9FLAO|nr:carboxypeptidase-like regulatory domain-containing protein [Winogradskyella immobilis]MCC1483624.1 carboxypeptidase-like regulatory domain-containing protein [Winogradskyella immobilis]MCG0015718.1 carboxypeptidase-like regulatory domain-containing protein [Winogradskyella immobilis]